MTVENDKDSRAAAAAKVRQDRLAEQLRRNLRQRKEQTRARRAGAADEREGLDKKRGE